MDSVISGLRPPVGTQGALPSALGTAGSLTVLDVSLNSLRRAAGGTMGA